MSATIAVWDPDSAAAGDQSAAVLALRKANRATLGPMPDSAFRDRAKRRGLLLGLQDDQLVAYMLHDIPRYNLIKVVHLCVSEDGRGSGVVRAETPCVAQVVERSGP